MSTICFVKTIYNRSADFSDKPEEQSIDEMLQDVLATLPDAGDRDKMQRLFSREAQLEAFEKGINVPSIRYVRPDITDREPLSHTI